MFGGSFAPVGWMWCNGQTLAISEYETLFQLIGTTYGGDGEETFCLPNLQGRVPIHFGQGTNLSNRVQGEVGGVEEVSLSVQQLPQHSHSLMASLNTAGASAVAGNVTGQVGAIQIYREATPSSPFAALVAAADGGGSQPHTNFQPYLCVNFIIAVSGIFPTQS